MYALLNGRIFVVRGDWLGIGLFFCIYKHAFIILNIITRGAVVIVRTYVEIGKFGQLGTSRDVG
jgi:hypothetical protein